MVKAALIILGVAITLTVLIVLCRTGRPIRRLLTSGVQGLCALGAVDLLGTFTGISLGLGWFSLAVSGLLGIPGVIGMLLMKLIMV